MSIQENSSQTEVDMFAIVAVRFRAGEPIHVNGSFDDVQGRLHVEMVNRLRRDTGLPVKVIHS